MKTHSFLFSLITALTLSACGGGEGASGATPDQPLSTFFKPIPEEPEYPADNAYSDVKRELGERLFWDPILSGGKNVACASCHHPDLAWADALERSIGSDGIGLGSDRIGFEETEVNSPSIVNVAYTGMNLEDNATFISGGYFWDLRADTLEAQALEPIKSDVEMRGYDIAEDDIFAIITARLANIPEYAAYFAAAFPDEPNITEIHVAKAIATFQRTIVTQRTRFDDYLAGNEAALTSQEITGLNKFVNGGCARCHSGPMLSDNTIHLGQAIIQEKDAVRTPSLRNVALTAPYMHDGSRGTLHSAVSLYEERGDLAVTLDDDDFNDITAFLNTLTDESFYRGIPTSVPSGLTVGGDINL